jgi:DNA polymerase-1
MIILNEDQLDECLTILADSELIAFDFESKPSGLYPDVSDKEASLHHKMLEIEGLALRSEKLEPVYIPFDDMTIDRIYLNEKLHNLFSQDSLFVAHNIQFDAKIADYFFGARPQNKFCTLVGYWYYDENAIKDAKTLAKKHFGMEMVNYSDAKTLSKEEFYEYAKRDAEATYQLYFYEKEHLEDKHFHLASTVEMEFIDVLIDMTLFGTPCDLSYLKRGEELLTNKAIELEAKIHREFGEFNIGSSQQLSEKIYGIKIKRTKKEGLKLTRVDDYSPKKYAPVAKWNVDKNDKTKRTTPSTDDKALSKLNTPAARLVQEYRSIMKLLSTYAIGYQKYVVDNKIYPTFNNSGKDSYQYGTVTGRLSSSAPNMQNISHDPAIFPKEDGEAESWWLREAIYAPEGYVLIVADEAQLEMRLLAHFTRDDYLVQAILSGEDVHLATAKIIYGKEEISSEERRFAKTQNFSTAYGQGIKAMAEKLGCSDEEAKRFRTKYFETFPGVAAWVEKVGNRAVSVDNKDHHVKTILGRKRRMGDIPKVLRGDTEDVIRQKRGTIAGPKRQGGNSIIPGSASDVLKMAMIYISRELREKNLDAHILLQIHDELVIQCKEEIAEEVSAIVKNYMEFPFNEPLRVPLEVNPVVCQKWSKGK